MEISFTGKRALVTGAAQGIGLGVLKKLVSCGAEVVALDVNEQKLKENLKELPGVETVVVDLRNWNSTLETLEKIGRVQLVVNNAGIHRIVSNQDLQEEDVNLILDVNLKATMAVCKHVVNDWSSAGLEGAIVNMASITATRTDPLSSPYAASKAAILQYSRCLALDCAPKGIRVNCVSPGSTKTEMCDYALQDPEARARAESLVPMNDKYCETEDIANAVAFLLCHKVARKITGVNLHVDGGFMLT